MFTAILKIIAIVLGLVERHFTSLDARQKEIQDEAFRKAMAENDRMLASDMLRKRLRDIQERNNTER